jgi:tripeptidyl-peptidase-1
MNVDSYLGEGYLERSDVEFQKLALMGLSIIIADGDNGAGDLGDPPMLSDTCTTSLNPDWPSQSPYITAVGSTYTTPLSVPLCYLSPSQGGIDCTEPDMPLGEVGVSLDNGMFWTTGGGFANFPKRPSYQNAAVSNYLSTYSATLPPKKFFNANGRAYPDVSACGHNLMTVLSGAVIAVDGTSASAPIFGGIVSLLNSARVQAGKPVLGFLNPLLYKIAAEVPQAFNDVVVGNNRCSAYVNDPTSTYGSCCEVGYSAGIGWDAMTGLGTPNFGILVEEVLKR